MRALVQRLKSAAGYSAVELMVTVGVMGVVGAMAAFQLSESRPVMKGDGAMRVVIAELNRAREMSISQRRQMQVKFVNPSSVQIIRIESPGPATTVLSTVGVEGGVVYGQYTGIGDTPDGFGNSGPLAFGAATQILFNSDGTLIDQSGNPLNGTVFLIIPGNQRSYRAVTIFGSVGRVRGYRWDGKHWNLV